MKMDEEGNIQEQDSPPLTFADLGITKTEHVNDSRFGKTRTWSDIEKWEWIFLVVNILGLPATFILSVYKMAVISSQDPDFVFALLLVINTIFCMYYVIHGVLRERPYEIVVLVIATTIVVIYSIVNFSLSIRDTVKLVRLVIACVLGPVMVLLGLYIARSYYLSANLIFRTVGATSSLQDICKLLYFFYGVLKLDLQLGISMVILILSTSAKVDTEDISVLSVGGVFTVFWFILGYFSARREHLIGTILFFIGSPFEPAYVIYKVVVSARGPRSEVLAVCTFVCAGLSLLVHAILVITMIFVYRNYGKGLKEKVYGIDVLGVSEDGRQQPVSNTPTDGANLVERGDT